MISFCCQQCSREYKVDDKYAGRKARCKQCDTYNVIPKPNPKEPVLAVPDTISFSCDTCDQQLKVKSIHAGKRVQCTSCGQPCLIPIPQAKAMPAKSAEMVSFTCQMCSARMKADKSKAGDVIECTECGCFAEVPGKIDKPASAEEEYSLEDWQDEPVDQDDYAIPSSRPSTLSSESKPRKTIPPQWKIPAAIATSLALGMIGVVIWVLIAIATGFQLAIIIIAVGGLTGAGLTLFTEKRSPALGFAAVFLALIAIFIGKAMVVKFVVIPAATHDAGLWDKVAHKYLNLKPNNDSAVCIASCMELRDKGKIPPELVWYVFGQYYSNEFGKYNESKKKGDALMSLGLGLGLLNLDPDVAESRKEEIDTGLKDVEEYTANMTSLQKAQTIQNHVEEIHKVCSFSAVEENKGFMKHFISSIGIFDIVSLLVGLATAFNLGSGKNGSFS